MNNIGVIGGADGTTQIVVSGSIGGPILWSFFGALALMAILYFCFYRRSKGKAVCLALAAVLCVAADQAVKWLVLNTMTLGQWSLACILGGGIGNLIDRVRLGYVVDMLDTMFMDFPVFNVADVFVVCGTVCALIYYLAFYSKSDEKNWGNKVDGTDPAANK